MKCIENFSFNSKVKWKCHHRQCHMNKKKNTHNKIQAILFQLQMLYKKFLAKMLFETSNNRSSEKEDSMSQIKFKVLLF